MKNLFHYLDRQSPIHRLTGAAKLVCVILWSLASMLSYDTRLLAVLSLLSALLFAVSRVRLRDVAAILWLMLVFMALNNILVFVFSPGHGTEIYGTSHELCSLGGRWKVKQEQLFYHLNLILKYFAMLPIVLLFVCTTQPSEFAASLNRIGVKYTVAYSVALALRYIPDVQQDYHEISQAQQARGIEMSRKESLFKRLKSASAILIPLILSSMDRIEVISNAMELRGFGKNKKRSWYMARPFTAGDYVAMAFCALLFAAALVLNRINGGRFYNPFV